VDRPAAYVLQFEELDLSLHVSRITAFAEVSRAVIAYPMVYTARRGSSLLARCFGSGAGSLRQRE
jgi:hypothetical protein